MSDRAPYSRVYWSIHDDPKFDGIRGDARLIGSWLLLLVAADMSYPSPAYLLPTVTRASVNRLVEAGLVDLLDGHRYRVHGLDKERQKRSQSASDAAAMRWHTERTPNPDAERMPSRGKAETSTSQDEAPRDPADIYWQLTGKFPKDRALVWIDSMASQYGQEPTTQALVRAHLSDSSVATLLSRTQDLLRAEARKLDVKEREDEARRLAEKRAIPRVEEPWRTEYREAIRKQYEALDGAA